MVEITANYQSSVYAYVVFEEGKDKRVKDVYASTWEVTMSDGAKRKIHFTIFNGPSQGEADASLASKSGLMRKKITSFGQVDDISEDRERNAPILNGTKSVYNINPLGFKDLKNNLHVGISTEEKIYSIWKDTVQKYLIDYFTPKEKEKDDNLSKQEIEALTAGNSSSLKRSSSSDSVRSDGSDGSDVSVYDHATVVSDNEEPKEKEKPEEASKKASLLGRVTKHCDCSKATMISFAVGTASMLAYMTVSATIGHLVAKYNPFPNPF